MSVDTALTSNWQLHMVGSLKCPEGYNLVFIAAVFTAAKQTTQIRSRPSIHMTYLILHPLPQSSPPPKHRVQILNLMSKTKYGKNSATIVKSDGENCARIGRTKFFQTGFFSY